MNFWVLAFFTAIVVVLAAAFLWMVIFRPASKDLKDRSEEYQTYSEHHSGVFDKHH